MGDYKRGTIWYTFLNHSKWNFYIKNAQDRNYIKLVYKVFHFKSNNTCFKICGGV